MSGLLIGLGGIGGSIFSQGLVTVGERAAKELDWAFKYYSWTEGKQAGREAKTWAGPVAVIWHSAGKTGSDWFAEGLGRKIDLGFAVDSWFPETQPDPLYRRVYSIKAGKGGRFHVQGANVVAQILYPDETHTSIDDEPKLHDFVIAKLAELTGETHTQEPPMSDELGKMQEAATKALQPENETPAQTVFYKTFFGDVRSLWKGGLSQSSIDGMKSIIHAFDTYIKPKDYPDELLAFVLGQAYNETGGRMVPVRETLAKSDSEAMRILNAWWASGKAQKAGVRSPYWADGFFGRGLFQETHKGNYEKAGTLWQKWFQFPLDFVKNRDLFLDPVVSALSAFIGSIEGKYTDKKFADYFKADGSYDFAEARRMVNGDRDLKYRDVDGDGTLEPMGDEIGQISQVFLKAIQSARKAADSVSVPQVPDTAEPPVTLPEPVVGDIDAYLAATYPDTEPEARRRAAMLADAIAYRLQPSPAIERGNFLPKPQKGTEMDGFKKWWESKGVNGGIVAVLSLLLMLTGNDVPVEEVANLGDKLVELVGIISALVSIWGRLRADTKIG